MRLRLVQAFAGHDGFGKLMAALLARPVAWPGAENVRVLILAANEARQFPPHAAGPQAQAAQQPQAAAQAAQYGRYVAGAAEDLCRCFMGPLQGLTEEELKRESQDSSMAGMTDLVRAVRRALEHHPFAPHDGAVAGDEATPAAAEAAGEPEAALHFWLALVLAHLRSSSLPLRLWAWDEMNEIVRVARARRPPARYVCACVVGEDRRVVVVVAPPSSCDV